MTNISITANTLAVGKYPLPELRHVFYLSKFTGVRSMRYFLNGAFSNKHGVTNGLTTIEQKRFDTRFMAYDETLANRIRSRLKDLPSVEEKAMMGGLTFMVNGKMCVGIIGDELMCRIDPNQYEIAIEKNGCKPMEFTGKPMKGYIMVEPSAMQSTEDFNFWIGLALAFNPKAKASKKIKKKSP